MWQLVTETVPREGLMVLFAWTTKLSDASPGYRYRLGDEWGYYQGPVAHDGDPKWFMVLPEIP